MKHIPAVTASLAALALAPGAAFAAPSADITAAPAVLPRPVTLTVAGKTGFALTSALKITPAPAGAESAVTLLRTGLPGGVIAATDAADALTITLDPSLGKEAYRLTVTPQAVTLVAGDAAGAFYGAQTLLQSVVTDSAGREALPAMSVDDAPRFRWRGLMIDSARHFMSPDDVRRAIDLMAMHKLNILHWHLTDDQGWRIEIKAFPKLTGIGATRPESPVPGHRNQGDGKPYGPHFYTQEDIRAIVAYAKARHITVVPEIEMPGHAVAAIASYPEFGNTDAPGYAPRVRTRWGVETHVFAPKEETFRFLDTVIGEVAALFPDSPYIHIGGDECPKDQWSKSPFAQALMRELGLLDAKGATDPHRLQSHFIARIEKSVNARGKKLIGWDEIQEGGLSPSATMMVWRDWKWAKQAIDAGNDVVMSPTSHCYLDHSGGPHPDLPGYEAINDNGAKTRHLTLERVYSLEPIPTGIKPGDERHVLGVQGNLWSEYLFNMPKWEYAAFPRAIALAEVAWSPKDGKDFKNFSARLATHNTRLDRIKVNYRKDDGSPAQPGLVIERK